LAPLATKWLFAASKADPLGSTNPEANVLRTPLGVNLYKNVLTADLKEGVPKVFVKGSSDSSYADTSGVLCWSG
jgi:hypothetical protein